MKSKNKNRKMGVLMAAALMTMTQCRKQETFPVTPATDTVKMTITAGPGAKTDIDTSTGAITWSKGDKLYVSDGSSWLGSLTLVGEGGSAQGTFTGSIAGIGEGETTCHFFYLGHDNGMAEPTGTAAANISLASQDGTLAGAMKYHAGYGTSDVTVAEGEAVGSVVMNTKMAIAHINFTEGTSAYTKSVTMGGTGVSNVMTVNPDGTFSGSGDGGIVIGGTTGERYVTLIPTETTDVLSVAFTGDATGSMTFANGIEANKFYGMKDAMTVTLEPQYVDFGLPSGLLWAMCNVGADSPEGYGWYFMWGSVTKGGDPDCRWTNCPGNGGDGSYNSSAIAAWDASYLTSENVLKPAVDAASVNWGGDWRMPTEEEFTELISNTRWSWTTVNGVAGYKCVSTKTGYTDKYIFLPAAGYRGGTSLSDAGSSGDYWSSSLDTSLLSGRHLYFNSSDVNLCGSSRYFGYTVRSVCPPPELTYVGARRELSRDALPCVSTFVC